MWHVFVAKGPHRKALDKVIMQMGSGEEAALPGGGGGTGGG